MCDFVSPSNSAPPTQPIGWIPAERNHEEPHLKARSRLALFRFFAPHGIGPSATQAHPSAGAAPHESGAHHEMTYEQVREALLTGDFSTSSLRMSELHKSDEDRFSAPRVRHGEEPHNEGCANTALGDVSFFDFDGLAEEELLLDSASLEELASAQGSLSSCVRETDMSGAAGWSMMDGSSLILEEDVFANGLADELSNELSGTGAADEGRGVGNCVANRDQQISSKLHLLDLVRVRSSESLYSENSSCSNSRGGSPLVKREANDGSPSYSPKRSRKMRMPGSSPLSLPRGSSDSNLFLMRGKTRPTRRVESSDQVTPLASLKGLHLNGLNSPGNSPINSRKNKLQRCSVCGELGHKSRTCQNAGGARVLNAGDDRRSYKPSGGGNDTGGGLGSSLTSSPLSKRSLSRGEPPLLPGQSLFPRSIDIEKDLELNMRGRDMEAERPMPDIPVDVSWMVQPWDSAMPPPAHHAALHEQRVERGPTEPPGENMLLPRQHSQGFGYSDQVIRGPGQVAVAVPIEHEQMTAESAPSVNAARQMRAHPLIQGSRSMPHLAQQPQSNMGGPPVPHQQVALPSASMAMSRAGLIRTSQEHTRVPSASMAMNGAGMPLAPSHPRGVHPSQMMPGYNAHQQPVHPSQMLPQQWDQQLHLSVAHSSNMGVSQPMSQPPPAGGTPPPSSSHSAPMPPRSYVPLSPPTQQWHRPSWQAAQHAAMSAQQARAAQMFNQQQAQQQAQQAHARLAAAKPHAYAHTQIAKSEHSDHNSQRNSSDSAASKVGAESEGSSLFPVATNRHTVTAVLAPSPRSSSQDIADPQIGLQQISNSAGVNSGGGSQP
ncbi:MAG: hypothetical protein SGPRY_002253, partial [Prymnesium sp.]